MKKVIAVFIMASIIICNCFADGRYFSDSQKVNETIELNFPFGYLELPIFDINTSVFDNDYFYEYMSEQKRVDEIKRKDMDVANLFLLSMNILYLLTGAPFSNSNKTYYYETPHEKYRREYQELSY